MTKYYLAAFMSSAWQGDWKPFSVFTTEHPIALLNRYNEMDGYENYLMSWQEITQEEYELSLIDEI